MRLCKGRFAPFFLKIPSDRIIRLKIEKGYAANCILIHANIINPICQLCAAIGINYL